jgi:hypothetical protein
MPAGPGYALKVFLRHCIGIKTQMSNTLTFLLTAINLSNPLLQYQTSAILKLKLLLAGLIKI